MGAGHHSIYIGDRDPDDMNQKLSDFILFIIIPQNCFPSQHLQYEQILNML